ncbi:hypothetical protein [Apilactobacillus ozensis]|uniref:hypothetical protein n=1 Tax=Apilactobacillus ozensis TaxID=866801 RepID=UPI00200A2015|nr:hypothetical protein [Apilactobacillus ozensis]MCK8606979.1 hypothetical protein [Apilactobacillus ozensis]
MKKSSLIKLIAPIVLAGVLAVTTVSNTAHADFHDSNIKDPALAKKMADWGKEDQTKEFQDYQHKLEQESLKEGREYVLICNKLGLDPYKQRTPAEQKSINKKINKYKETYGVPGSKDAKTKEQNNNQPSDKDKDFVKNLLRTSIQLNTKQVNKLKSKMAKLSHSKHLTKKNKQTIDNKIKVLNGYIKDAKTKINNLK